MFIGEYHVSLGEKNRIALPKKMREQAQGNFFITKGYDQSLIIVDERKRETLETLVSRATLLQKQGRAMRRYFFGSMQEIEYDAQGRFVVQESLKQFAHLQSKVVFLGIGDWIEVWAEEQWQEQITYLEKHITPISEQLADE